MNPNESPSAASNNTGRPPYSKAYKDAHGHSFWSDTNFPSNATMVPPPGEAASTSLATASASAVPSAVPPPSLPGVPTSGGSNITGASGYSTMSNITGASGYSAVTNPSIPASPQLAGQSSSERHAAPPPTPISPSVIVTADSETNAAFNPGTDAANATAAKPSNESTTFGGILSALTGRSATDAAKAGNESATSVTSVLKSYLLPTFPNTKLNPATGSSSLALVPIDRRASFLDAPPVTFDKKTNKEAKVKLKERQLTVQKTMAMVDESKEASQLIDLKKELTMTEHRMSVPELAELLDVNIDTGLSDKVVTYRLVRDGPNALPPKKETPWWVLYLSLMIEGFSLMLWIGGVLAIAAYFVQNSTQVNTPKDNLYLGLVLIVVVFITGTFSYFQESKSASIMNSFLKMAPHFAAVIRNGDKCAIVASELVVGDIVEVKAGDKIPADLRLVENRGLKVDNASLTGESEPLARTVECTNESPMETKNLVFFSTFAVEGSAIGIVVRTGERTLMGRIAKLAAAVESDKTPLAVEMHRFVFLLSIGASTMGAVFFIISLAQGVSLVSSAVFLIGVIVANVPEGIMPATTVALALTARRMAKMNCLVKSLAGVETLGSTSVICSDKTGTLTQNRMTVAHLWVNTQIMDSDTTEDQSKIRLDLSSPTAKALLRCAALCNRAIFKPDQEKVPILKRETIGDASESALLKCTEVNIGDAVAYRERSPKVCEIPFNSTNKYQLSIHDAEGLNGQFLLVMKGAPERIIERCAFIEINGRKEPMTPKFQKEFDGAYEALGGLGERVLGFAEFLLPAQTFGREYQWDTDMPNFPVTGLVFLGLISLIDPPRAAVPVAVATCQEAGVRVIMVTGDHPITAKAIARTVGIIGPESETAEDIAKRLNVAVETVDPTRARAAVVTGAMLKEMGADELDFVIRTHPELVFARTSPQQKLIIVEGVQRSGCIVAVTGDGVNDAPALRKADIGIAMGITGSDVSKDAAKMILLDDNFASVVVGIEEGRLIFDNLRKTIAYMLTSNIPEILPFLLSVIANIPQAMSTSGMLFVDLGTDIVPAIAMAYEKCETDIMRRPPRNPQTDKIVNRKVIGQAYLQIGVIQCLAGYLAYFVVYAENGFFPKTLFYGLNGLFENAAKTDLVDSLGQEWNVYQRIELERTAQSAFFLTVVITQWVNLINCKCRTMSIFQKGMRNHQINFALLFETSLLVLLIYTPHLNEALTFRSCKLQWWSVGLCFNVIIFGWDEVRRWFIRHHPNGFLYRETYY